jgi:hypothetical protein
VIRRRDRHGAAYAPDLDARVREATALTAEQAAAVTDPAARNALLREILAMPTTDLARPAVPTGRLAPERPRRLGWAVAAGAAAVTAAVVVAVARPGGAPSERVAGPTVTTSAAAPAPSTVEVRTGDPYGPGQVFSCVEEYDRKTLTHRTLAFDGTVTAIGRRSSEADPYVAVRFTVHRWYRGGAGAEISVQMLPPNTSSSVNHATYEVGSRLLVSGGDRWGRTPVREPLAFACGFTRWYDPATARLWAEILG